ncbi:hypothetical protein HYFRA_00007159 [Hymenoscyphus fraxineus]|uniref:Uncharacterized protein n=1 Tax=Hymenoscyphus fraxineus TaxID=746836 RepID=A0A9N9PIZ0_9HELO|nr:hypothetical protein HYFRA_00007159 [Hymenoscyphus fraxineus]
MTAKEKKLYLVGEYVHGTPQYVQIMAMSNNANMLPHLKHVSYRVCKGQHWIRSKVNRRTPGEKLAIHSKSISTTEREKNGHRENKFGFLPYVQSDTFPNRYG